MVKSDIMKFIQNIRLAADVDRMDISKRIQPIEIILVDDRQYNFETALTDPELNDCKVMIHLKFNDWHHRYKYTDFDVVQLVGSLHYLQYSTTFNEEVRQAIYYLHKAGIEVRFKTLADIIEGILLGNLNPYLESHLFNGYLHAIANLIEPKDQITKFDHCTVYKSLAGEYKVIITNEEETIRSIYQADKGKFLINHPCVAFNLLTLRHTSEILRKDDMF